VSPAAARRPPSPGRGPAGWWGTPPEGLHRVPAGGETRDLVVLHRVSVWDRKRATPTGRRRRRRSGSARPGRRHVVARSHRGGGCRDDGWSGGRGTVGRGGGRGVAAGQPASSGPMAIVRTASRTRRGDEVVCSMHASCVARGAFPVHDREVPKFHGGRCRWSAPFSALWWRMAGSCRTMATQSGPRPFPATTNPARL
jgi:hypothetical protein